MYPFTTQKREEERKGGGYEKNIFLTRTWQEEKEKKLDIYIDMARMNGVNVLGFVIAPLINLGLLATRFKVGNFVIGNFFCIFLPILVPHK
jgi:hypothetical protein